MDVRWLFRQWLRRRETKEGAGMDRLLAHGTVNAAQRGEGPPLFLLHSLLSDRASFDAVAPQLSRSFRVIVPELPGFGGSQAVGGGLAEIADRMAEAVRDGAGGEDAVVLGNGYGGFVALQMVIRHPDIATRLILADCGAAFSPSGRDAFRSMAAAAKINGLAAVTDVAMRRLFAPDFQARHPELMADRRAAFGKTDPQVFGAACAQLAELDLRAELANVKVPVLVIVGEHDGRTPLPMSEDLNKYIRRSYMKLLQNCGHYYGYEQPDECVRLILDFLQADWSIVRRDTA